MGTRTFLNNMKVFDSKKKIKYIFFLIFYIFFLETKTFLNNMKVFDSKKKIFNFFYIFFSGN